MEKTIIYAYIQKTNAYVGKTKNPGDRKSYHKTRFKGWEYKELDEVFSFNKVEWKPLESYWIEQFRQWGFTLENKNKGGGGLQGFRTQKETKQINLQSVKNWQANNKEKLKQYALTNKKKLVEYDKQYYLTNKEKKAEYNKQYRLNK